MKTKRLRSPRPSGEPIDWSKAKRAWLPNLKPSTQSISLRLPVHTLERIKAAANERDVPYQSLITVWLEEKVLMPVRVQRADVLRAKLAALDLTEKDVANAVARARTQGRKTRK